MKQQSCVLTTTTLRPGRLGRARGRVPKKQAARRVRPPRPFLALAVAMLVAVAVWGPAATANTASATLIVNTTDDADDGTCDAAHCSLREALVAANAVSGRNTIAFHILGAGPHTIRPTSALPTVTDPVIIDGYTQPGARPNTHRPTLGTNAVLQIELDGSLAGLGVDGLRIVAGHSTVRGLCINRFSDGIELAEAGGNVIRGNFIGTDVSGTVGLGNANNGIRIFLSPGNSIGGIAPRARNVISGNAFMGIDIFSFGGETGNVIRGNFIGTDASGTVGLGNGTSGGLTSGVLINNVPGNIIGGRTPGARNVISDNALDGVTIFGLGATNNRVDGNLIKGHTSVGIRIGGGAHNNQFRRNTILNNGTGIRMESDAGPDNEFGTAADPGLNCIQGNSNFGFSNQTGETTPAGGNFWGCPEGPVHPCNPRGNPDCDTVEGLVEVCPVLRQCRLPDNP
jgi:CSLREA domain-containing protein